MGFSLGTEITVILDVRSTTGIQDGERMFDILDPGHAARAQDDGAKA